MIIPFISYASNVVYPANLFADWRVPVHRQGPGPARAIAPFALSIHFNRRQLLGGVDAIRAPFRPHNQKTA
jgi:hypothetical protein